MVINDARYKIGCHLYKLCLGIAYDATKLSSSIRNKQCFYSQTSLNDKIDEISIYLM